MIVRFPYYSQCFHISNLISIKTIINLKDVFVSNLSHMLFHAPQTNPFFRTSWAAATFHSCCFQQGPSWRQHTGIFLFISAQKSEFFRGEEIDNDFVLFLELFHNHNKAHQFWVFFSWNKIVVEFHIKTYFLNKKFISFHHYDKFNNF